MSQSGGWLGKVVRGLTPRPTPPPQAEARPADEVLRIEGDAARAEGDWAAAARAYGKVVDLRPADAAMAVQWGHALKECGRIDEAEAAYRRAAEIGAPDPDAPFQLGALLSRTARQADAHEAYAEALRRDPGFAPARQALIAAGRRDLLPEGALGRAPAERVLGRIAALEADLAQARAALTEVTTYARRDYGRLRAEHPILPPPGGPVGQAVLVIVRAETAAPGAVRRTLTSLVDQRFDDWEAVVIGDADTAEHPVASLGATDPRVRWGSPTARALPRTRAKSVLALQAGVVLDPEALGWLAHARARAATPVLVCDHDHFRPDWQHGPQRTDPAFLAMPDAMDMDLGGWPGAIALFQRSPGVLESLMRGLGGATEGVRALLATIEGPIAHLPRPLASLPLIDPVDHPAEPAATPKTPGDDAILVVIPTRDQPAMLEACIASLKALAAQPDRLAFRVMDNRSAEPASRAALRRLATEDEVQIVQADQPFNWSRLNNTGASGSDAPILVFANDDMEALTPGWDDRLRAWLSRSEIGIVGARLLYPDRSVQHAGIVMGVEGRPAHEGRHAAEDDGGPMNRWHRSRPVAAVTGAFIACRRRTFETLDGFDERLAVAYNDIDFCLKARAAGLRVLYAADIELIHHESKTRGLNDTPERVAFDDAELEDLHRRWGRWLFQDPGYNPQWGSVPGRPFDGVRDPPETEILAWLDASAAGRPWAVRRDATAI